MDFIAKQPEAQLDRAGDPRLGMIGASYGGGIQNNTAVIDGRVDVITPQIAWHSLVTSLDKNDTAKGGWGSLLFGVGINGSTTPGITGGLSGQPAGFQFGRMQDPRTQQALIDGASTGSFTDADKAFFASRGPGSTISRVKIPTLISQGTNDTLFTLHEASENFAAQKAAGAPVSMIWFCGGLTDPSAAHGVCNTSLGPDPAIVLHASLTWLDRYLRGNTAADVGPRFRWVSDTGVLHSAPDYPVAAGKPLTGSGAGALPLAAGDTSGALIEATPAATAVNVPLDKPAPGTSLLGEPTLTMTYTGTAASSNGRVYAQIVDDASRNVLGNQVTPVPVTLDGKEHTLSIPLEAVAIDAVQGSSYTLQIAAGSNVYFAARQAGFVNLTKVGVSIPTVAAGASSVLSAAPAGGQAAVCTGRRIAFALHPVRGARVVGVRLYVDGRLRIARKGARLTRVTLPAFTDARRHAVRIDTSTRQGSGRRSVRTVRRCTSSRPRTRDLRRRR